MNFNNLNGYTVEDTAARTAIGSIDNNGIIDEDYINKFGSDSKILSALCQLSTEIAGLDDVTVKFNNQRKIDINDLDLDILTDNLKSRLLNFLYPVGSLYWSNSSTNPSDFLGGTWVQIKDKFIWAKGDDTAVSNDGGSKTVTLNSNQIPKHTHTVSTDSKTTTLPNHKHKITSLTLNSTGSHSHAVLTNTATDRVGVNNTYSPLTSSTNAGAYGYLLSGGANSSGDARNYTLVSGSNIAGYMNYANNGTRGGSSNKRRIIEEAGSHTHTLTGTNITDNLNTAVDITIPALSGTANNDNISSSSPNSVNIMPPYTVKYCWERTA